MNPGHLLYEGKAKKIYEIPGAPDRVRIEFKDSLTAFNALKKGSFENKGEINRDIASLIFSHLKSAGVDSHWLADEGATGMIAKRLEIIPLEVVVRNVLAGSTAKRLGFEEGAKISRPLVEFYYKNDDLQDPFVSEEQIEILGFAKLDEIQILKKTALTVNDSLKALLKECGLELIDFKIEFGRSLEGEILLADEITPDCCRLWDLKTQEKMDKDRFRRDLGGIRESYVEVLNRLRKVKGVL